MRKAGEVGTIHEWKQLAEREPDPYLRGDFGGIGLVFAELAKRGKLWRQELEGWNVEQPQQVLEWQNDAQLQALKDALLRVMQQRFGSPLPEEIRNAVMAKDSQEELYRWLDAAATATDLEAFRRQLE